MRRLKNEYQSLIKTSFDGLLNKYEAFFFDCDGVQYHWPNKIPHIQELQTKLIELKRHIFLITNNSQANSELIQSRIKQLYNVDIQPENIFTAATIISLYVKTNHEDLKRVFVIGNKYIYEEFNKMKIKVYGNELCQSYDTKKVEDIENILEEINECEKIDGQFDAVITGSDTKLNMWKFNWAAQLILRNTQWISSNPDAKYHTSKGLMGVGTGSIIKSLENMTGRNTIMVGKPNKFIIDYLHNQRKIDRNKILFIGDNILTDIKLGINGDIDTLLVLTGITKKNDLAKLSDAEDCQIPNYIMEYLNLNTNSI